MTKHQDQIDRIKSLIAPKQKYTGIGSRETPENVGRLFTKMAKRLRELEMILRSGGADGADTYFEDGVSSTLHKEIYLPWKGFNGNTDGLCYISKEALYMASQYHPAWTSLKPAVQKLHARNCYQILGGLLNDPSKFVICWTKDGADGKTIKTSSKTGGTGTAIRLAASLDIPVINFGGLDD